MTATFRTLERTDLNHVPERHAGVRHYFGEVSVAAERVANRGPEAFFVECGPPFEEQAHFHDVDQFQLFLGASGSFFQRRSLDGVTLQYADAYSTYGPFGAGGGGLRFFTLRARGSALRAYMPADRDKLVRRGRRRYVVDVGRMLDGPPRQETADPVIEPEADGLAAVLIRVPPGSSAATPPARPGAQYHCVLEGEPTVDGVELAPLSLGWVDAGGDAVTVSASTLPVSYLVLQFPFPPTPEQPQEDDHG